VYCDSPPTCSSCIVSYVGVVRGGVKEGMSEETHLEYGVGFALPQEVSPRDDPGLCILREIEVEGAEAGVMWCVEVAWDHALWD